MKTIKDITTIENNQTQPKQSTLIFISNDDKINKIVYRADIKKNCLFIGDDIFAMTDEQKTIIKKWIATNSQNEKIRKQANGYKVVKFEKLDADKINAQIIDNNSKIATLTAQIEKLQADTDKLKIMLENGELDKINSERQAQAEYKNKVAISKTPAMCTLFDLLFKAGQATSRQDACEKWLAHGEQAFNVDIYNSLYIVVKLQYGLTD